MSNFLTKIAQIFGLFLKQLFNVKTAVATFWETVEKIGVLFIPKSCHTIY